MSFDIFLACFRDGKPHPIERDLFETIFLTHDRLGKKGQSDPDEMYVEYADGSAGTIYCDGLARGSISFEHCGGEAFFANLIELADKTSSVIFWVSEISPTVVTNEATLKHLPPDFIEDRPVRVVHNADDIRKAIDES
jgi:hypothetical protein